MISPESEAVARQAERLYDEQLKDQWEAAQANEFVAIEPTSGDYFSGNTWSEAIVAARRAHPNRLVYTLRVGHKAAVHFGAWTL